jgi:DNA-binding NtrC family response regulator
MDHAVAPQEEGSHKTKIILAEDELLLSWVLADALRREGFEVIEAVDADDAITVLKFNPDIALVVCDMRMRSVEDGLVLARYIRAHHPGVALVLAAALPPPLEDNLFDAFFPKPYALEDIVGWIKGNTKAGRVSS